MQDPNPRFIKCLHYTLIFLFTQINSGCHHYLYHSPRTLPGKGKSAVPAYCQDWTLRDSGFPRTTWEYSHHTTWNSMRFRPMRNRKRGIACLSSLWTKAGWFWNTASLVQFTMATNHSCFVLNLCAAPLPFLPNSLFSSLLLLWGWMANYRPLPHKVLTYNLLISDLLFGEPMLRQYLIYKYSALIVKIMKNRSVGLPVYSTALFNLNNVCW